MLIPPLQADLTNVCICCANPMVYPNFLTPKWLLMFPTERADQANHSFQHGYDWHAYCYDWILQMLVGKELDAIEANIWQMICNQALIIILGHPVTKISPTNNISKIAISCTIWYAIFRTTVEVLRSRMSSSLHHRPTRKHIVMRSGSTSTDL